MSPQLVYITIEWEEDEYPGVPQSSMHRIVDEGPEFTYTNAILDSYESLEDMDVTIRYEDMPAPLPSPTHYLDHRVQ